MLTRLHVEHETQSMQVIIANIAPRDTVSPEPLMHDFANAVQAFSLYLKSETDACPQPEHRFLQKIEEPLKRLDESGSLITRMVKDRFS